MQKRQINGHTRLPSNEQFTIFAALIKIRLRCQCVYKFNAKLSLGIQNAERVCTRTIYVSLHYIALNTNTASIKTAPITTALPTSILYSIYPFRIVKIDLVQDELIFILINACIRIPLLPWIASGAHSSWSNFFFYFLSFSP